jgi:hypothetical protein
LLAKRTTEPIRSCLITEVRMTEQNKHNQPSDKIRAVQDDIRRVANSDMPGNREALRPGTLPGPPDQPHGDENRDPKRK